VLAALVALAAFKILGTLSILHAKSGYSIRASATWNHNTFMIRASQPASLDGCITHAQVRLEGGEWRM